MRASALKGSFRSRGPQKSWGHKKRVNRKILEPLLRTESISPIWGLLKKSTDFQNSPKSGIYGTFGCPLQQRKGQLTHSQLSRSREREKRAEIRALRAFSHRRCKIGANESSFLVYPYLTDRNSADSGPEPSRIPGGGPIIIFFFATKPIGLP